MIMCESIEQRTFNYFQTNIFGPVSFPQMPRHLQIKARPVVALRPLGPTHVQAHPGGGRTMGNRIGMNCDSLDELTNWAGNEN